MKFKNFEIASEIELRSDELLWDLHNFADFEGLELVPSSDAVAMKWTTTKVSNPWGCLDNKALGIKLYFEGLLFLRITQRDPELPLKEDTCVSSIVLVDPQIQHDELYMRTRHSWKPDDSFRLVFEFQSERLIEIEARTVELIPIA